MTSNPTPLVPACPNPGVFPQCSAFRKAPSRDRWPNHGIPALLLMALAMFATASPGFAQPVFEAVATATTSGDGTLSGLSIPVPASTSGGAVGDLLVAVVGVNINPSTQTPPGWTAVAGHAGFNGATCSMESGVGIRCQLSAFWKFSDGSETSVFINLTNPGSPRQVAGAVLRYSNTNSVMPIGPIASNPGTGATVTAPATTTVEANSLVLRLGLVDTNGPDGAPPPLSGGLPTERFNLQTKTPVDYNSVYFAGSDAVQLAAGNTGTAAWTGGDENWVASTIVIRPVQVIIDVDLSITKNDGETKVNPGDSITYTIVASNSSASAGDVTGASVNDIFPSSLACTWTCSGSSGASCAPIGSGDISDTANLPVGTSVTYSATCTVDANASGTILNTATVGAPVDFNDTNAGNNSAMDTTLINQAPIASCRNVTVDANASCVANASIDNGSYDPDNDAPITIVQSPAGPYVLGDTSAQLTITDGLGLSDSCTATVTVQDVTPPVISCNNPATIIPPDAPISFTATAVDNCSVGAPTNTTFRCFSVKKNGKIVDKGESCEVSIAGDTITIEDSGGVNDQIEWTVAAADGSGNDASATCSVLVVNPGHHNQ